MRADMCGASGGACGRNVAGKGGCISSNFTVSSGQILTINVGGVGGNAQYNVQAKGGYNGGGNNIDVIDALCVCIYIVNRGEY